MKRITIAIILLITTKVYSQSVDSLDIKIGQMIMVGMNGQSVDSMLLSDVSTGRVGGVIFFEKNITNENSYINLKSATWQLQNAANIPLFIAIDQEGGKVNRLKEKYGFPRSVTAEYLGQVGNLDSTAFYAEITASTLSGLGFNVNFAPVVDLSINKENPIIAKYGRAYSDKPDSVAMHAKVVINAHRKYNIVTALKHFPGHGSSVSDTHLGIADVTSYWNKVEIEPYKILLSTKHVDGVMSAHIVNKSLDKDGNPGTLSKEVVQGLLRNNMGYNGVVFSDDMQMHAIAKHYGLEKALKMAINAGIDVLVFSNNIQGSENRTVDGVHSLIKKLIESGEIKKERIDESYLRIQELKRKYYE